MRVPNGLAKSLLASAGFRQVLERFAACFQTSTWWLAMPPDRTPVALRYRSGLPSVALRPGQGPVSPRAKAAHRACLAAIRRAQQACHGTRKPTPLASGPCRGVVVPLLDGEDVIGYLGCCHASGELAADAVADLALAVGLLILEAKKEAELEEMNQTVKPRAIALSTVHTVHRLLSATLDLDELLPKMARLCTQILRSDHCSIRLVDERKAYLVPKALVDLRNHHATAHRIRLGRGVEGRVAKTGNVYFRPHTICVPLVNEDVIGTLTVEASSKRPPFTLADREILTTLTEQAVIAIRNAQLYKEQEKLTLGSIQALSSLLDAKSPATYTHSRGFVELTVAIAEEMHLSPEAMRILHYAALLPETGKVGIPESVLLKAAPLTGAERQMLRRRPIQGAKIVQSIAILKPSMPILLYHHERYDGSGYPEGLKGKAIPLGARIFAVAEAFDAMVGRRTYRKRMTVDQAIREIRQSSGTQFDPDVVRAFLRVTHRAGFRAIVRHVDRGLQPLSH